MKKAVQTRDRKRAARAARIRAHRARFMAFLMADLPYTMRLRRLRGSLQQRLTRLEKMRRRWRMEEPARLAALMVQLERSR